MSLDTFLFHLQMVAIWWGFIGLVWGYLLLHERYTGRNAYWNRKEPLTEKLVGDSLLVVMSVAAWPYSLYRHYKTGTLKALFHT